MVGYSVTYVVVIDMHKEGNIIKQSLINKENTGELSTSNYTSIKDDIWQRTEQNRVNINRELNERQVCLINNQGN